MNRYLAHEYDELAVTYAAGRSHFDTSPMLESLARAMPATGEVLDAGCGSGEPGSVYFRDRGYRVHGIDISHAMLDIARERVPDACFELADMLELRTHERYAGIAAVYCVFHIDRRLHQDLFRRFARALVPGGALLLTLATREYTGADEFDGEIEFLGHRLPYSHDRPEIALNKLARAGLTVRSAERIATGGETFLWVVAEKPAR